MQVIQGLVIEIVNACGRPDLAKLIVNAGGVAAMVDYVTEARGNNRLPGIMTLGYIAVKKTIPNLGSRALICFLPDLNFGT